MEPYWKKYVNITASNTEHGYVEFKIVMGLTGPILVMLLGDERIVIASRWKDYATDHGGRQLIEAITAGIEHLSTMDMK